MTTGGNFKGGYPPVNAADEFALRVNYVHMYKCIVIIMKLASCEHLISILINGCGLLQMASYRKQLAVVAERTRYAGQETEQ